MVIGQVSSNLRQGLNSAGVMDAEPAQMLPWRNTETQQEETVLDTSGAKRAFPKVEMPASQVGAGNRSSAEIPAEPWAGAE